MNKELVQTRPGLVKHWAIYITLRTITKTRKDFAGEINKYYSCNNVKREKKEGRKIVEEGNVGKGRSRRI